MGATLAAAGLAAVPVRARDPVLRRGGLRALGLLLRRVPPDRRPRAATRLARGRDAPHAGGAARRAPLPGGRAPGHAGRRQRDERAALLPLQSDAARLGPAVPRAPPRRARPDRPAPDGRPGLRALAAGAGRAALARGVARLPAAVVAGPDAGGAARVESPGRGALPRDRPPRVRHARAPARRSAAPRVGARAAPAAGGARPRAAAARRAAPARVPRVRRLPAGAPAGQPVLPRQPLRQGLQLVLQPLLQLGLELGLLLVVAVLRLQLHRPDAAGSLPRQARLRAVDVQRGVRPPGARLLAVPDVPACHGGRRGGRTEAGLLGARPHPGAPAPGERRRRVRPGPARLPVPARARTDPRPRRVRRAR